MLRVYEYLHYHVAFQVNSSESMSYIDQRDNIIISCISYPFDARNS